MDKFLTFLNDNKFLNKTPSLENGFCDCLGRSMGTEKSKPNLDCRSSKRCFLLQQYTALCPSFPSRI